MLHGGRSEHLAEEVRAEPPGALPDHRPQEMTVLIHHGHGQEVVLGQEPGDLFSVGHRVTLRSPRCSPMSMILVVESVTTRSRSDTTWMR